MITDPSRRSRRCPVRSGAAVALALAMLSLPVAGQQGDVFPGGDVIIAPPAPGAAAVPSRGGPATATDDLFAAVAANDFPAVQLAVSTGANIDARNRWGLSPVDIAVDKGFYEIAHFLLSIRNAPAETAEPQRGTVGTRPGSSKSAVAAPAAPAVRSPAQPAKPPSAAAAAVVNDQTRYAWPKDRPNPFSPASPAPGAALPAAGATRTP